MSASRKPLIDFSSWAGAVIPKQLAIPIASRVLEFTATILFSWRNLHPRIDQFVAKIKKARPRQATRPFCPSSPRSDNSNEGLFAVMRGTRRRSGGGRFLVL